MNKDSNKDKNEKNNIATHEADINLVKKFLDYTNYVDNNISINNNCKIFRLQQC